MGLLFYKITLFNPYIFWSRHEKMLPRQKHDSQNILADYGINQFSKRIYDKRNDVHIEPLVSFSFKSVTPFQFKIKTPIKKHNKSLHQQPLLLNDTDVISDDEDHIYTRIPNNSTTFIPDTTITSENFSTITNPSSDTPSKNANEALRPIKLSTHCSQIIPFYDPLIFKYGNLFQSWSFNKRLLFRYTNS